MKLFHCCAFDAEYAVVADTKEEALDKLKKTKLVAALIAEIEADGESVDSKDFSVHELRQLSSVDGVFSLES